MNTVSLTYKNEKNEKRTLIYDLLANQTSTQKWINIWAKFFESNESFGIKSENPTILKSLEFYKNELYELCYEIVNVHSVPFLEGWDDTSNYTQDFLNVLHDDFVENKNISSNTEVARLLDLINHSIHTLEAALRTDYNVRPSYFKSILRWPWPDTEWAQIALDEQDQEDNVNWFGNEHCLFLAYATLGKDLKMILDDEHYDLIRTDQVVPKTTISPWVTISVPFTNTNLSVDEKNKIQQEANDYFYNKAKQQQSLLDEYNIDYTDWIHKPGRIVIGINHRGSSDDWNWFADNSDTIVLDKIEFKTSALTQTAYLTNEGIYDWISS